MSTDENPPQRPSAADALLAEQASSPAEVAALREVLRAAQAPAAPGELRGAAAALTAFRAARTDYPGGTPASAPSHPGRRRLATLISVKAAAALVALTGMGGVALAASTGALPGAIDGSTSKTDKVRQVDHDGADGDGGARGADGATAQDQTDAAAQRKAAADATSAAQAEKKIAALRAGSDAQAVAALARMCNAYDKGGFAAKTRAEQSRAFRVLLRAAGGSGSVPEFCATVAAAGALDNPEASDGQAAAKARLAERRQQRADDKQGRAEERADQHAEERAEEQGKAGRPDAAGGSDVAQGSKRQGVGADPEAGDRPRGNPGDH